VTDLTKELVQLGAALALGCTSCLEQRVANARERGASDAMLEDVVQLVRGVTLEASLQSDALIETLIARREIPVLSAGTSCGCGGNC